MQIRRRPTRSSPSKSAVNDAENLEICPTCGQKSELRSKLVLIDEAWISARGKMREKLIAPICAWTMLMQPTFVWNRYNSSSMVFIATGATRDSSLNACSSRTGDDTSNLVKLG
jgi:hypothetical protein